MLVNIITVCYNSAQTIERTILSVLSQDYAFINYIIIDGRSNDKTLNIIEKYADKIQTVVSEPDNGIYDAMNKGLNYCTDGLVALINSDDVYSNKYVISQVVHNLIQHNVQIVYGDLVYKNGVKTTRYWKAGTMSKQKFLQGWMPPHPSFFALKSLYSNFGAFDTKLKFSADYELMLRFMYKNNATNYYLPVILVEMQVGGVSNQSFKNRILANAEDNLAWKNNNLKKPFFTTVLKPLRKISQYLYTKFQ